jgi:hypothetical protein
MTAPYDKFLRSLKPGDTEGEKLRKLLAVYDLRGLTRVRKQDEDLDLDDDDLDDLVDSIDERDDGESEGSATSRHVSHLADLISEATGRDRQVALDWLLHNRNGLALLRRTLGKRFNKKATPMTDSLSVGPSFPPSRWRALLVDAGCRGTETP